MKSWNCAFFIVVGVAGVLWPATADVKTTTEVKMFLDNGKVDVGYKTRYARENAEREDVQFNWGIVTGKETTLNLGETNQQIKLNEKFKIYTVSPLPQNRETGTQGALKRKAESDAAAATATEKTGSVVINFEAKPLGDEIIAGVKATGYLLTSHVEKMGCASEMELEALGNTKTEFWFADIEKIISPLEPTTPETRKQLISTHYEIKDGCKISYEYKTKGDVDIFEEYVNRLMMRMKAFKDDKVFYSEEITGISTYKLDDEIFAVPAFSKEVTVEEYENAREKDLRQSLQDAKAAKEKAEVEVKQ